MCYDANGADIVEMHNPLAVGSCRQFPERIESPLFFYYVYGVHCGDCLVSLKVMRWKGVGPYCANAA